MKCILSVCIVITLSVFSSVRSQEACNFEDVECVTKGGRDVYAAAVNGINGVIEPIDPLFLKEVNGAVKSLRYKLTNVTLTGMKECDFKQLKLTEKDSTWRVDIHCPHIAVSFNYVASGKLGAATIDSEGTGTMTLDDYDMIFRGTYGQSISEKDHLPHFTIESYNLETDLKGKLIFTHEALVRRGDDQTDEAAEYINKNYKSISKILLSTEVDTFMGLFMSKIKTFLAAFPINKVIPK